MLILRLTKIKFNCNLKNGKIAVINKKVRNFSKQADIYAIISYYQNKNYILASVIRIVLKVAVIFGVFSLLIIFGIFPEKIVANL